jgi:hypothetical protein
MRARASESIGIERNLLSPAAGRMTTFPLSSKVGALEWRCVLRCFPRHELLGTRLNRLMDRGELERTPARKWFIAGTATGAADLDLSIDDERMLSALRIIPGGSSAEIAALVGVSRSSVIGRAQRLARLGVVAKGPGGHWRAVERARPHDLDDGEAGSEFETPERAPLFAYDPNVWVNPIGYFCDLVFNSSPFACRRYG